MLHINNIKNLTLVLNTKKMKKTLHSSLLKNISNIQLNIDIN